MQRKYLSLLLALLLVVMINVNVASAMENLTPLDYSKVENWIINDNADTSKPYDLIFFIGTAVLAPTQENGIAVPNETSRDGGFRSYMNSGSELAENARVFCPMQRQVALTYTLEHTSHEELINDIATKEPYEDLKAVLDYYFEHYNKDGQRPFVLAGHSQGGAAVQVVLNKYFLNTDKRDLLKNMIAAYSIGYGVPEKDFASWPNKDGLLHFAEGPDDFNCLISWNTEGVGQKTNSFLLGDDGDSVLIINPLNWKRDETYAGINENEGVMVEEKDASGKRHYHISQQEKDLLDAQIDLKRGSILCSTTKKYLKFSVKTNDEIFGGKSLHFFDGKGYYNNIKHNLKVRLENFLAAKTDK